MPDTSWTSGAKRAIKIFAQQSGALGIYRRIAKRDALTVVMFHRVLPKDDPRFRTADPAYTMSLPNFEVCAQYFRNNYNVISLPQLQDAMDGKSGLPDRPLLITFDDGWEDTSRYAVPALWKYRLPSAIFMPSEILDHDLVLWKDIARFLWQASRSDGTRSLQTEFPDPNALVLWLGQMTPEERKRWLEPHVQLAGNLVRPLMMSPADVQAVQQQGAAIGAHGASHTPLTECASPRSEFKICRDELNARIPTSGAWFSFPHGSRTSEICELGLSSGFRILFTSDAVLNRLASGRPTSPVLGRIDMPEQLVSDTHGRVRDDLLGFFLAMRNTVSLQ